MSVKSFISESDSDSSDFSESELSFEEEEPEEFDEASTVSVNVKENNELEIGPYSEEPVADAEWLAEYNQNIDEAEILLQEYTKRLNGETSTDAWCSCGNCKVDNLTNPCECQCCQEIEGCTTSLNSELVLSEVESPPACITLHPGFVQVCLAKWSLRLSAGKYRTMAKKSYRVLDSEERFFRAVAYREFSQLVHGYLGKRRFPLPACAYDAIRRAFPSDTNTGYKDEEEV